MALLHMSNKNVSLNIYNVNTDCIKDDKTFLTKEIMSDNKIFDKLFFIYIFFIIFNIILQTFIQIFILGESPKFTYFLRQTKKVELQIIKVELQIKNLIYKLKISTLI